MKRRFSIVLVSLLCISIAGAAQSDNSEGPLGDYGDAPDGTSTEYVHNFEPGREGSFPTDFRTNQQQSDPTYVLHRSPQEEAYLGQLATTEGNALQVNRDLDDGWGPSSFVTCNAAALEVLVTVPESASEDAIYLNALFDWNHDGQWGGSTTCNVEATERQVAEWGIQNLALHEAPYNLEPGFQGKITLPAVTTGALPGDLWMRLTVTSTPVDTERFTPALQGGRGWTGQGNFEYGESEDYLTCLIFDADKPLEGCPAPLTTQQPIDPPPGATTPDAVDDEVDTSPSDGIEVDVLANDEDPADQPLRITQTSNAANGTVSVNPDGTVSYTPDAGFTGTDQFTYTVCDPDGSCDTATVIVNVAQTNSPPVADDDEATTLEGSETTVDVLDNDIDPDGDSLSIVGNTEPANGSISCTESVCSYTPDDGFVGTDSFTYTVSDGNGGTDTATATITVNDVNSPPTAQDATVTTDEDTPVDVDLVCTDPDGNPLSFAITDGPDQGTLSGSGDARTYAPADDVNGTDTFTYECDDGNGGTDTGTITVNVVPVNDPPTANDDSTSTADNTAVTVDVLSNDTDADGDALAITSSTSPANGSVSCSDTTCQYTPATDFNGTDSFTYTASDGNGGSDTATVTVSVNLTNGPPVANDDSATTDEDTSVSIPVLTNDNDPDGDSLAINGSGSPSNGSVTCTSTSCEYAPNPNFNGTDTFSYTVNDGNGETDTATVVVTVAPVNDSPVASDDAATIDEDTSVDVAILTNDIDPEGDTLTVTDNSTPANGSVSCSTSTCTYTPNADFNGTDQFTYTASDGNGGSDTATVTITVQPVNDAPTANDDTATTDEDTPATVSVLDNDTDPENDALDVVSNTGAANGTVSCSASDCTYEPDAGFNGTDSFDYTVTDGDKTDTATVTVTVEPVNDAPTAQDTNATTDEDTPVSTDLVCSDPDGDGLSYAVTSGPSNGAVSGSGNERTYTPSPNFNGTDSFQFQCSDGNGGTDTGTVTIDVRAVNDAPVAQDNAASTDEDTPATVSVLDNDTDPENDALEVASNTGAANGTVSCSASDCTYTPGANFNGTDQFTYTVSDGNGGTDTATVDITVNAVNDAPTAQDDAGSTTENNSVNVNVLSNDTDPEGDSLTIASSTNPSNGTVNCSTSDCTYTPDAGFTGTDQFTYTASDGSGGSDTATVTVNVSDVENAPVAEDDAATTNEDTPVTVDVLANDSDPDGDSLTIASNTNPSNGAVNCSASDCTYTPDANFNGSDQLTYSISDGNGGSDTATVTVTVEPVNDAPTAQDTNATTDEDTPVSYSLVCSDPDGDGLSYTVTSGPSNGTLSGSGDSRTYTPTPDFNGSDSFTYECADGQGGTSTGTVTIDVNPVNDAPVARNDSTSTNEDTPVDIDVLSNDVDPDGDAISISTTTAPSDGSVSCSGGTCTYTPDADFNGSDSFDYTVADGNGGTDTATATINVTPVNDAPVANDDSASTTEDNATTVNVLANDSDPENDALSIASTTSPSNGSVSCSGGSCTYTPNGGFSGTDSFDYTVADGNGGTDTAMATIDVAPNPLCDADPQKDTSLEVSWGSISVSGDTGTATLSVTNTGEDDHAVNLELRIEATQNGDTITSSTPSLPDTWTVGDLGPGNTATKTVEVTVDRSARDESFELKLSAEATNEDCRPGHTEGRSDNVDFTFEPIGDSDGDGVPDDEDNCPDQFGVAENNGCPASVSCQGQDSINPEPGDNVRERNVGSDPVKTGSEDVNETNDENESSANKLSNYGYTYYYCYTWDMAGYNYAYEYVYKWTPDAGSPNPNPTPNPPSTLNDDVDPDPNPDPNPPNSAPTASDDSATTQKNESVTIDVMANDSDPDNTNDYWWASSQDKTLDPNQLQVSSSPQNGSASANNGEITYTPAQDFTGTDSFTYQVCDQSGKCAEATVEVTVEQSGTSGGCKDEDDNDDGDDDDCDDDDDDDSDDD